MSVEQQHNSYWTSARHRVGIQDPLYLCYALLLVVAVSTVHLMAPVNIVSYERDVWHHLAVLNELLKSPFHAVNPHVLSDAPSRTFMPWYVLLALVGRSLGLTAQQLLGVSAAASMIVLVIGIRLFARAYFASVWAPLTLLTATFATWAGDFNHTGYHTLSTLLFSVSYPFGIVLASGFVSWWLVLRALRAPKLPLIEGGAIVLLTAFMYATHQLQAGFAIGGMMTFALFHGRYALARRGQIVTAIVAGLLLCRLWPYFDPLAYTLSGENITYDYKTNINWTSPWVQLRILGLALLGLAGLYDFRRKAWRWDLTIAAGAIAAGIGVALAMGLWIGLRFLPFLVAILQIALTALVLDLAATKPARTSLLRSPLGGVLCLLYAGWLFNVALAANSVAVTEFYLAGKVDSDNPDWSRDISDSMSTIRRAIGPGRVILAEGNLAYPVQANEMKVVSIPRPFPEVPDSLERQAASKVFFADATSNEERCRIIARYDVAAILYRADRVPSAAQAAIAAFGTSVGIHDLAFLPLTDAQRHRCNGTGASQQP